MARSETLRCCVKAEPALDESLGSYLQRLRSLNAIDSPSWLWSAITEISGKAASSVIDVAASHESLRALETLAGLARDSLSIFALRRLETPMRPIYRQGANDWPVEALAYEMQQVCPACLAEHAYLRADWAFWHAPVCLRHECALMDQCPQCHTPLSALRIDIGRCDKCLFKFSQAPIEPCDMNSLLGAKLVLERSTVHFGTKEWNEPLTQEELFGIWRLALFPNYGQAPETRLNGWVHALPAKQRLAACSVLGSCVIGRRLDSTALRAMLQKRVPPWGRLPEAVRLAKLQENAVCAGLDQEILYLLLHDHSGPPVVPALRDFGGKPPQLHSVSDAAHWTGLSIDAFLRLGRELRLHTRPVQGMGYDIDILLELKRRIGTLIPPDACDQILGVCGLTNELVNLRLLETIDDASGIACIPLESLSTFLGHMHQRINESIATEKVETLETALNTGMDLERLSWVLANVLNGGVVACGWLPPYRGVDLVLPISEIERMKAWPRVIEQGDMR